jgi:hypothetical protein
VAHTPEDHSDEVAPPVATIATAAGRTAIGSEIPGTEHQTGRHALMGEQYHERPLRIMNMAEWARMHSAA